MVGPMHTQGAHLSRGDAVEKRAVWLFYSDISEILPRIASPCCLEYLNLWMPWSLVFLPEGHYLRNLTEFFIPYWIPMCTVMALRLLGTPGLSRCDSSPPVTIEVLSPGGGAEGSKLWSCINLGLWGAKLDLHQCFVDSFLTDTFRMLLVTSAAPFILNGAIFEVN